MSKELRELTEKLTKPLAVLIVEDHPTAVYTLTEIVKVISPDSNLHAVGTAAAAKEALASTKFDVVFLDLILPGASGVTVLEYLVEIGQKPTVSVMTGLDDPIVLERCTQLGAFVVLPKPFKYEDIELVLRAAVARRR